MIATHLRDYFLTQLSLSAYYNYIQRTFFFSLKSIGVRALTIATSRLWLISLIKDVCSLSFLAILMPKKAFKAIRGKLWCINLSWSFVLNVLFFPFPIVLELWGKKCCTKLMESRFYSNAIFLTQIIQPFMKGL